MVLPAAVPLTAVDACRRLLGLAIRHGGLTPQEIAEGQAAGFFPHLRWEPAVWDVLPAVAAELLGWEPGDEWGEPQLLLRFPDEPQPWDLAPHVDQLPPWAADRAYRGVVGVALTDAGPQDGAAVVWPGSHRGAPVDSDDDSDGSGSVVDGPATGPQPVPLRAGDAGHGDAAGPRPVPLRAGDALVMHPRLGHSGTLNLGPSVRMAVYFRLVAGPGKGES